MRVPSFDRYRGLMGAVAFFLCGMIVGSAVYSGLQNDQMNQVLVRNVELEHQLKVAKDDIGEMKKNKDKGAVLTVIELYSETPPDRPPLDTLTQTQLKERLRKDLKIFIGRSVHSVGTDVRLARALLRDIVYEDIGGKSYTVTLKTVLAVDGVLKVWFWAEARVG